MVVKRYFLHIIYFMGVLAHVLYVVVLSKKNSIFFLILLLIRSY